MLIFTVVVLNQGVREFDLLELIKDCHSHYGCAGFSGSVNLIKTCRRLTFLPHLCWISWSVDLISYSLPQTDIPVIVLDQKVRDFAFLKPVGG